MKVNKYAVKLGKLYKTNRDSAFSNFASAKFYESKAVAEDVAKRFDAKVVSVLITEVPDEII